MLTVRRLHFAMIPPASWKQGILDIGFRLRGSLGLALKKGCCHFDATSTPCDGCPKRAHCHYGQSFETPKKVELDGLGCVGSLPHAWSLSLRQQGMRVEVTLTLAGMEKAHEASWKQAVDDLDLNVTWLPATWWHEPFAYRWQSLTPVRLRVRGKPPKQYEVAKALTISVVSKCRMLAAWHGEPLPNEHLPEAVCSHTQWCEESRYAFRHQEPQSMSGWMMQVEWDAKTPEVWKPWLQVAQALGVGRQTSFGLGAFQVLP